MTYRIACQEENFNGFKDVTFSSYKNFEEFNQLKEDKHNYEIISGQQSLYFDFDGKDKVNENEFFQLTEIIKKEFEEKKIRIDLYSSHGFEKFSYHVIVKGVYFEDHNACGFYAKKIISSLSEENKLKKIFDHSVYTSRRNFRILGSRKKNSTRIKKFEITLFQSNEFKSNYINNQLRLSLITEIENHYSLIEFQTNEKKIEVKFDKVDFSEKEKEDVRDFIERNCGNCYNISGIVNNFLILSRIRPFKCIYCNSLHTSDNAFVFKKEGKLYFVCRRNNENKILIDEDWEFTVKVKDDTPKKVITTDFKEVIVRKMKENYPLG